MKADRRKHSRRLEMKLFRVRRASRRRSFNARYYRCRVARSTMIDGDSRCATRGLHRVPVMIVKSDTHNYSFAVAIFFVLP